MIMVRVYIHLLFNGECISFSSYYLNEPARIEICLGTRAHVFAYSGGMFGGRLDTEFLKEGILGSRIPDIIMEESGHFRTMVLFPDYFKENSSCWSIN